MGEVLIVLTKSMGKLLLVFANRYGPSETMLIAVTAL